MTCGENAIGGIADGCRHYCEFLLNLPWIGAWRLTNTTIQMVPNDVLAVLTRGTIAQRYVSGSRQKLLVLTWRDQE
jgi:hypothetical protein